jgi:DNA repair exonuclease SbcCD nuclease subunit
VWAQPYFERERADLAPNLHVITTPEPVEIEGAVLYPAPLEHRQLSTDPTEWLRAPDVADGAGDLPRILLAHGSIQGFSSDVDEEGMPAAQPNLISLERLPAGVFDYVALGDWHGTREVASHAWYSGTPEPDRFPKGADHDQGGVLLVRAERGQAPSVQRLSTGMLGWHVHEHTLTSEQDLAALKAELAGLLETRARKDLLRLSLAGHLSLEGRRSLDAFLESLASRLLRLKLDDRVRLAPSEEEMRALVDGGSDPLISSVASRLVGMLESDPERAPAAEMALRELYLTMSG